MKKIIWALLVLSITACSSGNGPNKTEDPMLTSTHELEQEGEVTGSFGSHEAGSKIADRVMVFVPSLPLGEGESNATAITEPSGGSFAVISATGCNRVLTKAKDKCTVRIKFLKNKEVGSHTATMSVGTTTVNLSATVEAKAPATLSQVEIKVDNEVQTGEINFGDIALNGTTKVIALKNNSLVTSDLTPALSGGGVSLLSGDCGAVKPGRTCYVRIHIKPVTLDQSSAVVTVLGSNLQAHINKPLGPRPFIFKVKADANGVVSVNIGWGNIEIGGVSVPFYNATNSGYQPGEEVVVKISNDNVNQPITRNQINASLTYGGGTDGYLVDIIQWGDFPMPQNMGSFFAGEKLITSFSAVDIPDLSSVTSLNQLFRFASNFNGDISNWDVSNVDNVNLIFGGADNFNQNLSSWCFPKISSKPAFFSYPGPDPMWGSCPAP